MKKLIVLLCTAALILSMFTGCNQEEGGQSDILRIMGNIKTENLDPLVGVSHEPNLMSSIFGALIRRGENGVLEPGIIQDWSVSQDGLTTTFILHEGVKFSDGSDLTSDDVIFSLDKMGEDPMMAYAVGKYIWEKVDDYTFTMTGQTVLDDPVSTLSTIFIVPSEVYSPDTFAKSPIGAGPYQIENIEADGTVNLTVNENYYGETPHYTKLVIKAPLNTSAAVIALQNREIDIVTNVTSDQLPIVKEDDRFEVIESPGYTSTGIWFYGPLQDDKNLRFAIAYGIDREKLVKIACNGEATVTNDLIASRTLGNLSGAVPMPGYDVEKAKEYLAASNYQEGDVLTLTVVNNTADAQCIMDDLKKIGIEIEINQMDLNSFYQSLADDNMGMCILANGAENATTAGLLQNFSSTRDEDFTFSAECDELIARCSTELDPSKREELYKEILEIQADFCNIAPLYETNGNICYAKGIEGITEFSAAATYLYPETLK